MTKFDDKICQQGLPHHHPIQVSTAQQGESKKVFHAAAYIL
jgi:hypothetical protein